MGLHDTLHVLDPVSCVFNELQQVVVLFAHNQILALELFVFYK